VPQIPEYLKHGVMDKIIIAVVMVCTGAHWFDTECEFRSVEPHQTPKAELNYACSGSNLSTVALHSTIKMVPGWLLNTLYSSTVYSSIGHLAA